MLHTINCTDSMVFQEMSDNGDNKDKAKNPTNSVPPQVRINGFHFNSTCS